MRPSGLESPNSLFVESEHNVMSLLVYDFLPIYLFFFFKPISMSNKSTMFINRWALIAVKMCHLSLASVELNQKSFNYHDLPSMKFQHETQWQSNLSPYSL